MHVTGHCFNLLKFKIHFYGHFKHFSGGAVMKIAMPGLPTLLLCSSCRLDEDTERRVVDSLAMWRRESLRMSHFVHEVV